MINSRAIAAHILTAVSEDRVNLETAFEKFLNKNQIVEHAFIKALCFGVLREYFKLIFIMNLLLDKPLKKKETLVKNLILSGLYESIFMQTPEHACVSETVQAAVALKKQWAKGLVNAVLRNALRKSEKIQAEIEKNEVARFAHPQWLIDKIRHDWPSQFESVLYANNQQGPLCLRVNQQQISRDEFLKTLSISNIRASAIEQTQHGVLCAEARDITSIPGYSAGLFSVQDSAAQLATELLSPQKGEHILDACAAPGGKTTHLLETQPDIHLVALDNSNKRLERVKENLNRLKLSATIIEGDASKPGEWWDGQPFDRILLDAPCSATGVIRRHPDIKLLRQADDIQRLVKTQQEILFALWPLLKPGGMLLYATCSVLKEENEQQIQQVSANLDHANIQPIPASWGIEASFGRQILPGQDEMDGFYYSLIYKSV